MRDRFADRVVELLLDPARRARMGAAGRERARQHAVEVIAERWEAAMLQGLGASTRVAPRWAAPWPGVREPLWRAIAARLPGGGRVRICGAAQRLPPIAEVAQQLAQRADIQVVEGENADAILDWGGLCEAEEPTGWLSRVAEQAGPDRPILSVVPWSEALSPHRSFSSSSIAELFDGADEHGLTVEAEDPWSEPARCWLIRWRARRTSHHAPKPCFSRPRPQVSVCMIVRDCADTVRTALSSVTAIADEIHVLDTGSLDRTIDVVRAFASEIPQPLSITEAKWPGDFAVARNLSIENARGDWILWIDADERMIGAERLRRLTQTEHFEAYAIRQHNHIFDRGHTQIEIPFRLFRNGRGYRFFGAVHEHPERALNEHIEPWTVADGVEIFHAGYLTEAGRVRKLLGRNLRLLNEDFARYPGRMLTDILYLRDCVNLCWFDQRDHGRLRPDHADALRLAIERFEQVYLERRDRYYHLGRKYYDQGLSLLGEGVDVQIRVGINGVPITHRVRQPADALWLAGGAVHDHLAQSWGSP